MNPISIRTSFGFYKDDRQSPNGKTLMRSSIVYSVYFKGKH